MHVRYITLFIVADKLNLTDACANKRCVEKKKIPGKNLSNFAEEECYLQIQQEHEMSTEKSSKFF